MKKRGFILLSLLIFWTAVMTCYGQPINVDQPVEIKLSFAGDCTLGYYYGQDSWNRFDTVAKKQGYEYFLRRVAPIFKLDDLTIVNLEGPLTTGGQRAQKTFAMRGEPEYTQILTSGSVEAVSLANNHSYDYGAEGLKQTKKALDDAGIGYFIQDQIFYKEVKGVKFAFIGEKGWENSKTTKDRIKNNISQAKKEADVVIIMFHWGEEQTFYPNKVQQDLAYTCIDAGADLVVGSHPHVVQGIEIYKDTPIVYSLSNFSFGGNRNPSDKDSFIFQQTFIKDEEGVKLGKNYVIPCMISSTKEINNYQPTAVAGKDNERIINRLKTYSSKFKQSYFR